MGDHSELFILEQAMQQIKEGVIITDFIGRIIFVNSTYCEVTGYQPAEVIEKTPDFLKSNMHDYDFYKKMWKSLYEKGYWKGKIFNRKKGGEIFSECLEVNSTKDKRGHITRFIFVFSEVGKAK